MLPNTFLLTAGSDGLFYPIKIYTHNFGIDYTVYRSPVNRGFTNDKIKQRFENETTKYINKRHIRKSNDRMDHKITD